VTLQVTRQSRGHWSVILISHAITLNSHDGPLRLHLKTTQPSMTTTNITPSDIPHRCRLRDLGIEIGELPCGKYNSITDAGVLVGHATLISGDGKLIRGEGPVRTGVTVILPHDRDLWKERCSAGSFVLNGNGTVTGLDWLQESGLLEGPIALTNTFAVGDVYRSMLKWMISKYPALAASDDTYLPVIGECDDSRLNDIQGMYCCLY